MALTDEQLAAMRGVIRGVIDAVNAAGPTGAPGGVIYAALMAQGCSLTQYNSLMFGLVRMGKLRQDGDLYFVVEG